jgi:3-isopropylmalate/(R)-2-methylmalate dehydratase small subunit
LVFRANRPGWVDEVRPGDIIIAGRNFGMGSSRPASRSLKLLGISCVIAESINGLFFRNCVNYAFPAMECPGVSALFAEGNVAQVDFGGGAVRNLTSGKTLQAKYCRRNCSTSCRRAGFIHCSSGKVSSSLKRRHSIRSKTTKVKS